jgi:hypothetical protein
MRAFVLASACLLCMAAFGAAEAGSLRIHADKIHPALASVATADHTHAATRP